MKKIIDIIGGSSEVGVSQPIPIWMTDTEYPAPCPCGRILPDAETVIGVSEEGHKRLFHIDCLGSVFEDDEGDDD